MKYIVIKKIEKINSGKYPILGEIFRPQEYYLSPQKITDLLDNKLIEKYEQ